MGPIEEATTGAIGIVQQVVSVFDKASMYAGRKSLIDVSKEARVEPLLIVDSALMSYEHMPDVSQTMQALFAGYYLQAIEMLHTIEGIEVSKKLAPLNPNRSPNVALMGYQAGAGVSRVNDWRMNPASYVYSLPTKASVKSLGMEAYHSNAAGMPWGISLEAINASDLEITRIIRSANPGDDDDVTVYFKHKGGNEESRTFSQEDYIAMANGVTSTKAKRAESEKGRKNGEGDDETTDSLRKRIVDLKLKNSKLEERLMEGPVGSVRVDKDVTKMVTEVSPLSIGKLYDVTFKEGKETVCVKVAIRLLAKMVPTTTIMHVCTLDAPGKKDVIERFHGVRSGELEFVNHFVFCNDLIEAHRKASISDKSGLYKEILSRRNKGILAGLLERNPSVAVASNLAIIDSNTLELIEGEMGGTFKNSKVRNAVFETTSLMIMAVVDRGYDRVCFYHRGIEGYTGMSIREIKANSKGDGGQIADIMKSFLKGSAPQL